MLAAGHSAMRLPLVFLCCVGGTISSNQYSSRREAKDDGEHAGTNAGVKAAFDLFATD